MKGHFATLRSDLERSGLRLRRAWPRRPGQLLLDLDAPDLGQLAGQWFADPAAAATTARKTHGARLDHRLVLQPAGADRVLTQLAPLLARTGTRLVGHRPERRAVVALEGGRRYAKLVPADRLARLRHSCLRTQQLPVRTPTLDQTRTDVADPLHHAVTTQTLPGTPLSVLLRGPRAAEALRAVGASVATLHAASPPAGAGVHGPADEIAVTRTWERRAREFGLAPEPSDATDDVPPPRSRLGLIHRDLHDGQFVLTEDDGGSRASGVGLLDFDLMAAGDPALDLANLIVHLQLRERQGVLHDAESAVAALLEGYRPDPDTLAHITWYRGLAARRVAAVYAFRSPDLPT